MKLYSAHRAPNPRRVRWVMAEKGIDMGFRIPASIEAALEAGRPDMIVTMGCSDISAAPDAARIMWDLPDPEGEDINSIRILRDETEKHVSELINQLDT